MWSVVQLNVVNREQTLCQHTEHDILACEVVFGDVERERDDIFIGTLTCVALTFGTNRQ